jgi:luciferase family oxidoreductase group 1
VLDQAPVPEGVTPAEALQNTIELARHADRLGYHRYWIAEHHAMLSHGIAAPEIMVGRVAAATTGIRVGSGGVLLSHYSALKVAEVFRTLEALFPGRIDLGIGRSSGANAVESYALRADRGVLVPDDFDDKLAELLGFLGGGFPDGHPFRTVHVTPDVPGETPVWLLGSSPRSAQAAAAMGLPYAFAQFINPVATAGAFAAYRAAGGDGGLILAASAVAAETPAEAERLFATQKAVRQRITNFDVRPVPTPERALAELAGRADPLAGDDPSWPRYLHGTPDTLRAQLTDLAGRVGADEIVIVTTVHDHKARLRSYELLAEAFELRPRA